MNIRTMLQNRVKEAMTKTGIPSDLGAHIAPSKNAKFGDYQANGAMAAAKAMKANPRELAQQIVDKLSLDGIASKIEIAGPGFINIHLDQKWLAEQLRKTSNDERLGITAKNAPTKVVIDYSAPNLAKEMHVGHLRSTIIGDAVARINEFTGNEVIRQNHVGDWGTQFGMLIAELEDKIVDGETAELALQDLEKFYQASKKHFDDDEEFANRARNYVVKLQSGDEAVLKLWEKFREISLSHSKTIYEKLNVTLSSDDVYGESAYNDDLSVLTKELCELGLVQEDKGALVAFLEELADKEGNPSPVIIQKKDGGYLYATTDLAAIRYRTGVLAADEIQYFIDDRQSLHMKQVFALARKAKFVGEQCKLEHRAFGKMLGKDGKPFKTRTGGTIKLADLLDEAMTKAAAEVKARNPDLNAKNMAEIGKKVGISAIKYADLSKTRTNDYVFDWENMLSFEGNTGPYMQYAYARIASIFRKANISAHEVDAETSLDESHERALALKILRFSEVIDQVVEDAYPHVLCTYLYELASLFMSFYEACPILKEDVSEELKFSRLQLCKASSATLRLGLDLLGIEVLEQM